LVKLLVWDCCYFHVLLVVLCNSSLFVRCLCVVPCLLATSLSLSLSLSLPLWSTHFPFLLFLPSSHSSTSLVFFHPHTCAADPQGEGGGREEAKEQEGGVEGEEEEVEVEEKREGGEEKKEKKKEKVVKKKNNNNNKRRW
jgi:hypothetical protein